ncbi:MAG: hypothetical protein H6701_00790 [Myxococcales bacterium]|nr:hypothetical protein [Myxococcales bacterium]
MPTALTATGSRHCSRALPRLVYHRRPRRPTSSSRRCDAASCARSSSQELRIHRATAPASRPRSTFLAPARPPRGHGRRLRRQGIFLISKGSIGKSELGLRSVAHGHRLVADDVVILEQTDPQTRSSLPSQAGQHHMGSAGSASSASKTSSAAAAAVRDRKRSQNNRRSSSAGTPTGLRPPGVEQRVLVLAGCPCATSASRCDRGAR